ncbi:MAG: hypothetical protein RLZZ272_433 [Actinomycetota bacterium]
MTDPTATERSALTRAVAVAAARRPCASPNPTVGCTVLDEHEVLGSGTSEPAGGRHAEVAALAEAGERARGATAVITLEPCAHHGRTPPCTEALLGADIARVVFARTDPNPLATGGARAMRAAGIEVIGPLVPDDLLARAVDLELAGTGTTHRLGRPFVTLKLAQRSDGGLVATDGSRWITGARARLAVHRDRDRVDAVLVGVGTVLADDPLLDARDLDVSAPDGIPVLPRPPRAVVLDSEARTPPSARVVRPGSLLLVAPDAPVERVALLRGGGASLREVPRGPGGLDPVAALGVLVEEGITTVLAEPGPTLAASLMAAGLVDRLVLHVAGSAPDVVVPALALDGWRLVRRGGAGPDRIIELVRRDVGPHAVAIPEAA